MHNATICFDELMVMVNDNVTLMTKAMEAKDYEAYQYWERQTFLTLGHHSGHITTDQDEVDLMNALKFYWKNIKKFSNVY